MRNEANLPEPRFQAGSPIQGCRNRQRQPRPEARSRRQLPRRARPEIPWFEMTTAHTEPSDGPRLHHVVGSHPSTAPPAGIQPEIIVRVVDGRPWTDPPKPRVPSREIEPHR